MIRADHQFGRRARIDPAALWVARFGARYEGGRMWVTLGPELCMVDMPAVVGLGVITIARIDQYVIPTLQGRTRERWSMFATPDGDVPPALVDECRAADVVLRDHGTVELPMPGIEDSAWCQRLQWGRAIPTRSHLLALTSQMSAPRGHA